MKKGITLLAALALGCGVMSAQSAYIYRQGFHFDRVPLTDGTVLRHTADGSAGEDITVKNLSLEYGENGSVKLADVDSCVVRVYDIPDLYLTLDDYPDATGLWDKELYLDSKLTIVGNGYTEDMEEVPLKIKGRGNSTWDMPKKPIRFKFSKKTDLGGGVRKSKNYAVLANFIDPTLMKNTISLWIARRLGIKYANNTMPCNVYINGKPQGTYLLTEKIGLNSASVDLDDTKAILFELSIEYDEAYKFRSQWYDMPVMVKDPDFDELYVDDSSITPSSRLKMWQDDYNTAESLAVSGRGFEAFDLNSFVDYILLNNIAGNNEIGYPKSVYMYKESIDDPTYKIGPPWDMDYAYNYLRNEDGTRQETSPEKPLWLNQLFFKLVYTSEFMDAYKVRFEYFKTEIYPELLKYIDEYAALIEPSAKLNGLLWPDDVDFGWVVATTSFDAKSETKALKAWLEKRIMFLESRIEQGMI